MLEYAKKMTNDEVSSFRKMLSDKQDAKIQLAQETIEKYPNELIAEYHNLHKLVIADHKKQMAYLDEIQYLHDNKLCECRKELILIKYQDRSFWGCPDYKNGLVVHKAWNYVPSYDNRLLKNWLGDIITKLNLKGKLHTKYLWMFYKANNLADLQKEYTGLDSELLINRFTTVKEKSTAFENRQLEILRNQWPVVIPQFPVKYKYQGQKEKICFIDILCSNDEMICIYECKTSMTDINSAQMTLYTDVINKIISTLKINKKLTIDYLIED